MRRIRLGHVTQEEKYAEWLIEDQCRKLLKMNYADIGEVAGLTRQTIYSYHQSGTYENIPYASVVKLERYLEFVKAALLTTETKKDAAQSETEP